MLKIPFFILEKKKIKKQYVQEQLQIEIPFFEEPKRNQEDEERIAIIEIIDVEKT